MVPVEMLEGAGTLSGIAQRSHGQEMVKDVTQPIHGKK